MSDKTFISDLKKLARRLTSPRDIKLVLQAADTLDVRSTLTDTNRETLAKALFTVQEQIGDWDTGSQQMRNYWYDYADAVHAYLAARPTNAAEIERNAALTIINRVATWRKKWADARDDRGEESLPELHELDAILASR